MKKALKNPGVQAFVASIICIILGLLIGYIVLLFINPQGAAESITNVIKNFFTWSKPKTQLKQFGNTLAKTMPLLIQAVRQYAGQDHAAADVLSQHSVCL